MTEKLLTGTLSLNTNKHTSSLIKTLVQKETAIGANTTIKLIEVVNCALFFRYISSGKQIAVKKLKLNGLIMMSSARRCLNVTV